MQPDPHPHLHVFGPAVLDDGALDVASGLDGCSRAPEDDEEGIPLGVDLDAVVRGEGGAQQVAMFCEHRAVVLTRGDEDCGLAAEEKIMWVVGMQRKRLTGSAAEYQ